MTEPTRDALRDLAHRLVTSNRIRTVLSAEEVNLAAACVRRVPELEAEVERLRAAIARENAACDSFGCTRYDAVDRAAATREGTDA